jgi:AcrR family transcriptional regulator
MSGKARERLLSAAGRLFYTHGVAATGIDTITAEANVAKMSLYNNFLSKADLVQAYLDARHQEWLELYRRRIARAPGPRDRVLAVFDAYIDHAALSSEDGFRGCGLLNVAAELPAGDPGRLIVRRQKEHVQGLLSAHLAEIAPDRAPALAEHLSFLLEGAMTRAGLEGDDVLLRHARAIAANLIDA